MNFQPLIAELAQEAAIRTKAGDLRAVSLMLTSAQGLAVLSGELAELTKALDEQAAPPPAVAATTEGDPALTDELAASSRAITGAVERLLKAPPA